MLIFVLLHEATKMAARRTEEAARKTKEPYSRQGKTALLNAGNRAAGKRQTRSIGKQE